MIIHVELLDEGTPTWYPVEAVPLGNHVHEIVGQNPNPEDLHWEFKTGDKVRCSSKRLHAGERLVAYELSK